ncbi:MAG: DEAD/DEAH box helicase [Atopobiaceae bacterium]|nr:DEAD/DEAH box helicase [Atopobiaceae bacterium]
MTSFGDLGLSASTLAAVDELGYTEPTPVQEQAIPAVLAGSDVMAAAQTGTGKTAAFLLPTLARLNRARRKEGPHVLVVTPTRELAQQIEEVARVVCAHTHHRTTSVVGGVGYEPQREALKRGCDVLVATPGRLLDLMGTNDCDLSGVQVLVLDEADRMLDMGFLPDMRRIVAACPKERQTLLFSATLSDDVLESVGSLVHNPVRVEIAPKGTAAETVEQYALGVSAEAKKRVLVEVLRREGAERVIVFCRGKHRADHLCRILRRKGFSAAPIHGDRSQNQRMRALAQFSAGEVGVLVATDVLARGIDISEVAYVVNVDVPHESENYIHRIGRTGRAGEQGWALMFVDEDEYLDLRDIERLMDAKIDDYPRAEGFDVGEHPAKLDAARSPRDELPGKKARKRQQQRRRETRPRSAGKGASGDAVDKRAGNDAAGKRARGPQEPRRQRRRGQTRPEVAANKSAGNDVAGKRARGPQEPRRQQRRRGQTRPRAVRK